VSAVLLVARIAIILLDAAVASSSVEFLYFIATTCLLAGSPCFVSYRFAGDPFWPYHAENHFSE